MAASNSIAGPQARVGHGYGAGCPLEGRSSGLRSEPVSVSGDQVPPGLRVRVYLLAKMPGDKSLKLYGPAGPRMHPCLDYGLSGPTRARPGRGEALAGCRCRADDVLVVTKLDRLARSFREVTDSYRHRGLVGAERRLAQPRRSGLRPHRSGRPARRLFNILGTVAEFESDLIRACTREGMAIVKPAGKLCARKPKLTPWQQKHLMQLPTPASTPPATAKEVF